MTATPPASPYAAAVTAAKAAGGTHGARAVVADAMQTAGKDVSTQTTDHQAHLLLWKLPRALMQGTRGMRQAGSKATGNAQYTDWLPREPAETPAQYTVRLNRSTLFNAFRKTVKDMTGKVFQRAIVLGDDVPDELVSYAENIDLAGRHLNVFARDVFYDGMQVGINYILVDMPPALANEDGSTVTLAQEQVAGQRPYFVHVKAEDLIGFKSDTINGVVTLTMARIRECATVPDGDFDEKQIEQIRVLIPGAWAIYREQIDAASGKKSWVIFEQGGTSLKYIPLVPVYINRTGFMIGEPPLEDLADLNVAHWQSSSDQRNILHVARVPILFGAGFDPDTKIEVGPNSMVRASNPDAKLDWVEHTGAAIASGQTDLDKLELQMQVQGLQLLAPQPGGQTATGEMRDEAKENSPLAMMAMALGDALECGFGMMADYMGISAKVIKSDNAAPADDTVETKDKAGGSITVNTDFGVGTGTGVDLPVLLQACVAGKLSDETFLSELKRRDILADSVDPAAELAKIDEQKPELTAPVPMNLQPQPGDPDYDPAVHGSAPPGPLNPDPLANKTNGKKPDGLNGKNPVATA